MIVDEALELIADRDGRIGAFVEVDGDRARADARASGRLGAGPLSGVPVAVKELFDVESADNSYGSLTRYGHRATADSEAVTRLRRAGAVIVGLTRSHEFGWGITTHHPVRGSTRNPRDLTRVAGGSSGGSAAAVAAGMVPLAIGTDTGGSIRIPAAFCGVLGLKTTPGRISRRGCVALAPSFDTPGLLAATVDMLERGLVALAGPDRGDPATLAAPSLSGSWPVPSAFAYGVPVPLQPDPLTPARQAALDLVDAALEAIGGRRADTATPDGGAMNAIFVPQMMAEAHFVHTRMLGTWPSMADSYGADVAARLTAAGDVTIADYLAARSAGDAVRADFARVFCEVSVVVSVVGASGPSLVTDPDRVVIGGTPKSLLSAMMPSTLPQNVGGLPSLTVPAGVDEDGLPIGVQLTGAPWSEFALLDLGRRLEAIGAIDVVGWRAP